MTIQIRPYADEDQQGVRDLILTIQQDEFGIPITYEDQPDLKDIKGSYRKGAGEFWIASNGTEIVGSIALIDIGEQQAALRKMFVRRDHRGHAGGVAGKLLDTLLQHAKDEGVSEVYLGTTDSFRAAHRFYEKTGFHLVNEADLPGAFPRMAVDTRFYLYRVA